MIPWPDAVRNWGTTPAERRSHFGCEELVAEPDDVLFRGVDVAAPAPIAYRWICQMRIAPYSYDLLDNRGRQSPQRLISGLDDLEPGQRIASIFRVVSFEPGRRVTMLTRGKVFGLTSCTYRADPVPGRPERSRIVARLAIRYPRNAIGTLMSVVLPPGDLVMMRRQLLNFAGLAARTAADARVLAADAGGASLLDLRDQVAGVDRGARPRRRAR